MEKIVSPVPGSARIVGVTHGSFPRSVPRALTELGVERALVFQAIEESAEKVRSALDSGAATKLKGRLGG